jgi:FMN reductase
VSDLVALVGNPRPGSRTAGVAQALLDAVGDRLAPDAKRTVLDLAELTTTAGPPLGAGSAERYAEPLAVVLGGRFLVVATPTYKGSYTGLLKSFLDHVAAGALRTTVAVPLTTVGSPAHTLAADVHLRPLLVELGAITPTPSLVVTEPELADPAPAITRWLETSAAPLHALL